MKTIRLEIDDDVYQRISTAMGIRQMTGSAHGILDEFIVLLIKSIEAGLETKHVRGKPGA